MIDAGTGIGNGRFVRRPSAEVFGNVYLRYRARLGTVSGSGGPYPIQLHSSLGSGTIAEMALQASPATAQLKCSDNVSFRVCPTVVPFTGDAWHVVQIGLEGLGTANGRCVLRVDDLAVCEMTTSWVNRGVRDILGGSGALDRSWDGVLDIDDVLLVQGDPPPARLALSGPQIVDAGDCAAYRVTALNDFDGGVSAPVRTMTLAIGGPGAFTVWSNASCAGDAGMPIVLDAGMIDVGIVYGGPARMVMIGVSDLAGGLVAGALGVDVRAVEVDAGAPDAGVVDAGVIPVDAGVIPIDAGIPDAGTIATPVKLNVGCGCAGGGGDALLWLLALYSLKGARRIRPRN